MNVLITSPRAPVALEWLKVASRSGHTVTFSDSLRYPVACFSALPARYERTPAPRLDFAGYARAMLPLITWADVVIPTCEDIFYLAQLPLTPEMRAKCLMPDNELLFSLHHKYHFAQNLPTLPDVRFPETRLITQASDIVPDTADRQTVLKPVFSRFGRSVVRGVSRDNGWHLPISADCPWVQQARITGQGLCNYAICQRGKVIAHTLYRPRYLLNDAAATYFEPVNDVRSERFIHAFAARTGYHGQVAFDFMDDGQTLWVLECNPRATSGLHLVAGALSLDANGVQYQPSIHNTTPLRVSVTLPLLFGIQALKTGKFKQLWQDYQHSQDVIADIPAHAHALALAEMVYRKWRYHKPLTNASTFDIEYDGAQDNQRL